MAGIGLPQPLSLTRFRRHQYLPRVDSPVIAPLVISCLHGEFGVSEALNQQIDRLEEIYKSEIDPEGRAFVPLADAHRRLGDLDKALAIIQKGLGRYPDFASAHMVSGWVYRSRREPDDAMRSFERVLELDAENSVARAAIAELIDDQRAQAYRDKMVAKKEAEQVAAAASEDERPVVAIASLAPEVTDEISAEPDVAPGSESDGEDRPGVPIASLAPDEIGAAPDAAPESGPHDDAGPVVEIASLAPEASDETGAAPEAAGGPVPDIDNRRVVSVSELAPEGSEEASYGGEPSGAEIHTETLAELYAGQGAIEQAIEVYRKLIEDDPDNEALGKRLAELESLEPDSGEPPAKLDVGAGLGALPTGSDERWTVPIESLAPDHNAGDGMPDDPFPSMNRS